MHIATAYNHHESFAGLIPMTSKNSLMPIILQLYLTSDVKPIAVGLVVNAPLGNIDSYFKTYCSTFFSMVVCVQDYILHQKIYCELLHLFLGRYQW